jgi:hypothetical protein
MIWTWRLCALVGLLLLQGCATYDRRAVLPVQAEILERSLTGRWRLLSREVEDRILALNPERVTDQAIRETLSNAPAPRIINIHGGIYPVHLQMVSFAEFLVGMGYPRASVTNPADGTYTFSCYESATRLVGYVAWHYEKEGLRPMLVGHSQGGFQIAKILHKLADDSKPLAVWSPLTWKSENRHEITDPLTGRNRPVTGMQLPFATAVGTGGLTRFLPNQWSTWGRLRKVPDSVEEFTGFYKGMDLLGGDLLGYGSANHYRTANHARWRYHHRSIPNTKHLLADSSIREWINHYQPSEETFSAPRLDKEFESDSANILWAADVWHSMKKHWVLELQRAIRAKRDLARSDAGL